MIDIDIKDPQLYADWSYEDLGEHIKALQATQSKKAGYRPRQTLLEMLDPTNEDFLGSGMSSNDWMVAMNLERLEQSFHRQKRPERKRRMQYVIGLSKILAEIEVHSIFATALARGAIEEVIEGDWPGVRIMATQDEAWEEDFATLPEECRNLWLAFRALCQEAFDTRPDAEAPPKPKN